MLDGLLAVASELRLPLPLSSLLFRQQLFLVCLDFLSDFRIIFVVGYELAISFTGSNFHGFFLEGEVSGTWCDLLQRPTHLGQSHSKLLAWGRYGKARWTLKLLLLLRLAMV